MNDQEAKKSKWELCEVGMFRLPGIVYEEGALTEEEHQARVEWAKTCNCGKPMTDRLWSFRNQNQRDMFILRWS